MARKAKKKTYMMPRLSVVDLIIYWILFLLMAFLWMSMVVGPLLLRRQISFADEMVVAVEERASYLWMIIPFFAIFIITFILWVTAYVSRQPIFGLRNFKYGPPAWPKVYPVFMKNKPYVWVSQNEKRSQKHKAYILAIVLLVSMIPLPLSICGRECLMADGSVRRYNSFNRIVDEHPAEQIENVVIAADLYSTGKYSSYHWGVDMTLTTSNGQEYYFDHRSFHNSSEKENAFWLSEMLKLKSQYWNSVISYEDIQHIDKVIYDRHLTEQEAQMLYQLFEISS